MSQLLQTLNAIAARRGEGLRPELTRPYIPDVGFPMLASFARAPIPLPAEDCSAKGTLAAEAAKTPRPVE